LLSLLRFALAVNHFRSQSIILRRSMIDCDCFWLTSRSSLCSLIAKWC